MAVIKKATGSNKGRSFSKSHYTYVRNGRIVIAKWPRKRGPSTNPVTIEQNEWFRQASKAIKYTDPYIQFSAMKLAHGSPLYPRDLLMSAMAGRLYGSLLVDGKRLVPMARLQDISADLDDLLGDTPGTVAFRGNQLWEGLPPPDQDSLLRYDFADAQPYWDSDIASDRWNVAGAPKDTTSASGANNTKGLYFRPSQEIYVTRITMALDVILNQDLRFGIAFVDSSLQIQSIAGETSTWEATTTGFWSLSREFATPIQLPQWSRVVLYVRSPDQVNAYTTTVYRSKGGAVLNGLPIVKSVWGGYDCAQTYLAQTTPAPGHTFGANTDTGIACNIEWYPAPD